jgi:hypothetical protein
VKIESEVVDLDTCRVEENYPCERGSDEILLKSSSQFLFFLWKSGTKLVVFRKLYF